MVTGVAAVALATAGYFSLKERIRLDHEVIGRLELRLAAAEQSLQTLEPVSKLLFNGPQRFNTKDAYKAQQATGAPNARGEHMDSPNAWCPAKENAGAEWLALTYEPPVTAASLRIHANYARSAVVRITTLGDDGSETELWSGDPAASVRFADPVTLHRIKLHLDTAKVPGWNEIDAVAAVDAAGTDHWAAKATASSEWTQP